MKKLFTYSLLLGLLALLLAPSLLLAVFIPNADNSLANSFGQNRYTSGGNIDAMLNTVANYTIGILIVVAIFYILWAAYTFVTSAGAEEKVNEARKRIMFAAIGIIVALLTKGIVALVLSVSKS